MRESIKLINHDPEAGILRLQASLEAIQRFAALLAVDPPTQELRRSGELALARAELARDRRDAAAAALDRVLLDAELSGELASLDAMQIAPSLRELFEERRQRLSSAPRSRLHVECSETPSSVLVDARKVDVERITGPGLLLAEGSYAVAIATSSGLTTRHVDITPSQALATLACEPGDEDAGSVVPLADAPEPPMRRLAPRGVEASLVALGLAGAASGGVLLGLDGTCRGGGSNATCPMVYETDRAGVPTLVVGAALLATGVALLAVDATRKRKQERARIRVGPGFVQF